MEFFRIMKMHQLKKSLFKKQLVTSNELCHLDSFEVNLIW